MRSVLNESEICEEAELIERFVRSYRRRFAAAIVHLNARDDSRRPALPEMQCLRLCVETMDMMLVSQDRMARSLRRLCTQKPLMKAA